MSRRPTSLADIARSLGVSKTLVSLVVNDKGDLHGISKDTQERVRQKIIELNYEPNAFARGFRTGKTYTIGLVLSDISNRFYSRIARTLEDLAWNHGYTLIICSTDEKVEKEEKQIRLLRERKIDGLIISTSQDNSVYFDKLVDVGLPHVLIDRVFEDMRSPNVSVDNFGGGRMIARHFLMQAISKVAIIGISPYHLSTINDRINGFKSTFGEAGFTIPEKYHIRAPFDKIEDEVKARLQDFYNKGDMPEAFFALNNNITSVCLKYLRSLSLRIPEDVLLAGFDDVIYFSFTQPTVTTIAQPIEQISKFAFDLLIRQIEKQEIPDHQRKIFLPVDILIRESSVKF